MNRKEKSFFVMTALFAVLLVATENTVAQQLEETSKNYSNPTYRFSVLVPNDWKLHGELKNDTMQHRAIVDWGLPKIYSDIEKTDIENSISITAYKRTDIKSVDDLILWETSRVNAIMTVLEVDKPSENARIYTTMIRGLKYKGKSYFVFNNGIGYVITFMATPGTFDKNINVFEKFYNLVKYN